MASTLPCSLCARPEPLSTLGALAATPTFLNHSVSRCRARSSVEVVGENPGAIDSSRLRAIRLLLSLLMARTNSGSGAESSVAHGLPG